MFGLGKRGRPLLRGGKILAAVLLASLAAMATAAPVAQATPQFTAAQYPALFTSESFETKFELSGAGTSTCKSSSLRSEILAATTVLTMSPEYSECSTTISGSSTGSTFRVQGCLYTFSLGETASKLKQLEGYEYTGSLSLACPAGNELELRVYSTIKGHELDSPHCIFKFPPQSNVGSVDYGTAGSPAHLKLRTRVTGMAYSGSAPCSTEGTATVRGAATIQVTGPELSPRAVTLDME